VTAYVAVIDPALGADPVATLPFAPNAVIVTDVMSAGTVKDCVIPGVKS
jgi:hypothetical protein